jgi:hypothetical protein
MGTASGGFWKHQGSGDTACLPMLTLAFLAAIVATFSD